jgi:hypothetical protein
LPAAVREDRRPTPTPTGGTANSQVKGCPGRCAARFWRIPAVPLLPTRHEAAHGLASARGVKDTSRQGRYHNIRFSTLAAELGLNAEQADGLGWSVTTVTAAAADVYAPVLDQLAGALVAWRRPGPGQSRPGSNNGLAARCPCGRRIRVSAPVLATAPITCGACGDNFTAPVPPGS